MRSEASYLASERGLCYVCDITVKLIYVSCKESLYSF